MKKTFSYLLLIVLLVCGKQTYNLLISNNSIRGNHSGALSDIADEVIAIPLRDSGSHTIKEAKYIRQEGNNLFLISNETLYRFNRKGEFICRVTDPEDIRVAGYVVNPANQQLIVLGNTDDIFYYSYDGELLTRKKLRSDLPEDRHMLSISMHNNRIFTTEESKQEDTATQTTMIKKQIVEYDTSFQKLQSHSLTQIDLERSGCPIGCLSPEVAIEPGTGTVYAYAPFSQPDNLLRDTLYIKQKRQSKALRDLAGNHTLPLLPIRMGTRFWVSTYYEADDASKNYTFCYDTKKQESWQIHEGLKDNFYQTGPIRRMEPIDPYCHSYCFCKSGKDLDKAFPGQAPEESLVLFIVRLKA